MNVDAIIRTLAFYKKRMILKIMYQGRIRFLSRGKLSKNVDIRILSRKGKISFGRRINIRPNVEITADANGFISIGNDVFINRNCLIVSRGYICIEDGVTIGPNTSVYDHNHKINNKKESVGAIIIKKGTWIGANVVILKDVTIGPNAIIAAGSIISKDVPPNTLIIQKRTNSINNRY